MHGLYQFAKAFFCMHYKTRMCLQTNTLQLLPYSLFFTTKFIQNTFWFLGLTNYFKLFLFLRNSTNQQYLKKLGTFKNTSKNSGLLTVSQKIIGTFFYHISQKLRTFNNISKN